MEYHKTVLMPIKVCVGDYCWGGSRICPHFDNEGGHLRCKMCFGPLKYDREGHTLVAHVLKPEECRRLKEV